VPDVYAQLDVNYQEDDRILSVTPIAELLYLRGIVLCKRLVSDGVITDRQVRRLADDLGSYEDGDEILKTLERSGLWERLADDSGWQIRSWLKHNMSRDEIDARRDADAERKRRWRSSQASAPVTQDATDGPMGQKKRPASRDGKEEGEVEGQEEGETKGKTVRRRASRAPDEFPISPDHRAWASGHNLTVDLDSETERFLNHHRAKGNTFKDWTASWRNWMLRAQDYKRNGSQQVATFDDYGKHR
jgi:hypothetical protein